jgi:hypothetical protein
MGGARHTHRRKEGLNLFAGHGLLPRFEQRSRKLPDRLGTTPNYQLSLLATLAKKVSNTFARGRRKPHGRRVGMPAVTIERIKRDAKEKIISGGAGEAAHDICPGINGALDYTPATYAL